MLFKYFKLLLVISVAFAIVAARKKEVVVADTESEEYKELLAAELAELKEPVSVERVAPAADRKEKRTRLIKVLQESAEEYDTPRKVAVESEEKRPRRIKIRKESAEEYDTPKKAAVESEEKQTRRVKSRKESSEEYDAPKRVAVESEEKKDSPINILEESEEIKYVPPKVTIEWEAQKDSGRPKKTPACVQSRCQAPDCRCADWRLPKSEFKGQEKQIPQFITITFDDAVNTMNYPFYEELFDGLKNPDSCSAQGTFFVSHEYTDYSKVNALYTAGHEIALHSVTHTVDQDYWRNANVDLMMREFGDEIVMLEAFANVPRKHIRGMRLPFLQMNGNSSYVAGQQLGLLYDSSWPSVQFKKPGLWPYTLNYRSSQDCPTGPCPNVPIPGFWVSPMVSWDDREGYSCAMVDSCGYAPKDNETEIYKWIVENFERHYESNRSPFGMYMHAAWFTRSDKNFQAVKRFLHYASTLSNVYISSMSRVIQYLRNPTLGRPFKGCFKHPQTDCAPNTCVLQKSWNETRYMTVCDECPEVYPWLGNPLGKAPNN